jgi:hypothetical protein
MTLGLVASATIGCWGVTGLDRLEYQDCLNDRDCGPEGSGRQCAAGRCVPSTSQPSSGGSGAGAGARNGSDGGVAGAPGGSGGEAGAQESCSSNADCVALHSGAPYLCKNQRCVGLTSTDCPEVLGLGDRMVNLTDRDPIVLGAYAWLGVATMDTAALGSYGLAVDEFNLLGGLPGGTGGALRPVLLVVCEARPVTTDASIQHLVTTLEVPGIVAPLSPPDLNRAVNLARGRVLFMNPTASTSIQADVNQNKFLWHLLGSPEDYAPPMAALLERTDAYLVAQRAGTSDATTPLHVTLVESDFPTLTLTVQALYPLLRFNGMTASENEAAGYLRRVGTKSSLAHDVADTTDALDDLEQHPPDVVLAMATSEFREQALRRLELDWATVAPDRPRPFYLVAPDLVFGAVWTEPTNYWELASRVVGIKAACDSNPGPYQDYVSRLMKANPGYGPTLFPRPSYYDALYYLLYSVVASAPSEFTGKHLAQGFLRIIDSQAPAVDIGPSALMQQFALFSDVNHRIQLIGTMGPPNFDLATGTRKVPIDAWCVTWNGSWLDARVNVIRYDDGEFDGVFPDLPGF